MRIVGLHYSTNANGEKNFTIHGTSQFEAFYKNVDGGRNCTGERVESVYVGTYDCSGLKPGMEIEILYDKVIKTAKSTFQPVKRIEVLNKQ